MAAPLLLLPLLSAIGQWVIRHLVVMLILSIATFLFDLTSAYLVGTVLVSQLNAGIASLAPQVAVLVSNFETNWSSAASFLALANSVIPLDFAVYLVGILSTVWVICFGIRFTIFVFRGRK